MAEEQDSGSEYDFAPKEEETPVPQRSAEKSEGVSRGGQGGDEEKVEERICPNCGFHAVGRMKRNRCPECSGDLSATGELLQFSDAGWLRTLANGLFLMIPGLLVHCLAMTESWIGEGAKTGAWLHVAGAVVTLAGAWLATMKESRVGVPAFHWAGAIRGLAMTGAVLAVALALSPEEKHPALSNLLVILLLLSFAGLGLSVGLHIRALAFRIPNDSLFWWSQNLSWLVPLAAIGQIPFHVMSDGAKKEFLLLFMAMIPFAGMFTVIALSACWTLLKGGLELQSSAGAAEGIIARRILKEKQMEEVKKKRRG